MSIIQTKRGKAINLPSTGSNDGELLLTTDSYQLYGTFSGVVRSLTALPYVFIWEQNLIWDNTCSTAVSLKPGEGIITGTVSVDRLASGTDYNLVLNGGGTAVLDVPSGMSVGTDYKIGKIPFNTLSPVAGVNRLSHICANPTIVTFVADCTTISYSVAQSNGASVYPIKCTIAPDGVGYLSVTVTPQAVIPGQTRVVFNIPPFNAYGVIARKTT